MPDISPYESGYWDGYHGIVIAAMYHTPEYLLGYEDGEGDRAKESDDITVAQSGDTIVKKLRLEGVQGSITMKITTDETPERTQTLSIATGDTVDLDWTIKIL